MTLRRNERSPLRAARAAPAGFTLPEILVATCIGILVAGVVLQVLVFTARSTAQTSAQADTQAQARRALAEWERHLRDGQAVLTTYTLSRGQAQPKVFTTRATSSEQTVVAALPALDATGAPCSWKGVCVVYDCMIWTATRDAAGLWNLKRYTVTNAFRMAQSYLAGYTVPTAFARQDHLAGTPILSGAASLDMGFFGSGTLATPIAPNGGVTAPPAAATAKALPYWTDASGQVPASGATPVTVTDVATVSICVQFSQSVGALIPGNGQTSQFDLEKTAIRLRNRPSW